MELLGVSELADVGDGGDEGDATAAMASASRGRDRQSVSASDGDRNVRRKNCALDFDTLDCPICLESLAAPVYQCQNGHTACAACCKKLLTGSCPSCSLPIGSNRCIVVEKIIESLEVHCQYAVWGCKEMLQYTKRNRDEHEDVCKFRPYQCPVVGCYEECLKSGLPTHFEEKHNLHSHHELTYDDTEFSFSIETSAAEHDKSYSQYVIVSVFEDDVYDFDESDDDPEFMFLVHHQFQKKFCRYSFSCTSFQANDLFQRYHLSVNFEGTGGFKGNHSIEGPIPDNQKDKGILSKVVRHGYCLLVPRLSPVLKDGPKFEVKLSFS